MSIYAELVIWDVQHGSAAYLRSPNNKHIVLDLGIGSYKSVNTTFSPLLFLRDQVGVEKINHLIISHPHKDHIEDILNIDYLVPIVFSRPKNLDLTELLDEASYEDLQLYEKYIEIDESYVFPYNAQDDPNNPSNYGGLQTQIFPSIEIDSLNINNLGIIAIFNFANIKIIFPGDIETSAWLQILEDHVTCEALANADVYIASHHGRESGFNNDIMNIINPSITIISDGRHCDTSAIDRYRNKSQGWTIHRSDGQSEKRKCLSTYSSGTVNIKFGKNDSGSFLEITIA